MAYIKTDWVNGVTKVNQGNLNNLEDGTKTNDDKLVNTFSADINSYFGNTKLGDDGQDVGDWTSGVGTLSQDTTNVKIGSGSIRVTDADNIVSSKIASKNNLTIDLTSLNNGETSTDDDYIYFIFFISNVSAVTTVQVAFSTNPTFNGANSKLFNITTGLITGWNFAKIKKSDFTTSGTGSFNGVQSIRTLWNSNSGFIGEYVSFQLIQLVKKDPLTTIPNPLQRFGVRDFTINSGEWFVGEDFGEIVWKELSGIFSQQNPLQATTLFSNATVTVSTVCVSNSDCGGGGGLYIDDNNRIVFDIVSDELRLISVISGIADISTVSMPISVGDRVDFILKKEESDLMLIAYRNVDYSNPHILTGTSSLNLLNIILNFRGTNLDSKFLSVSITEISHAHHSDISETTRDTRITDLIQSHTNIEWLGGTW